VLGICLGSQLLAEVLGTLVYRNRMKEIGWFPVRFRETELGSSVLLGVPDMLDVLHWHGETYDLPPGCAHLAESEGCAIQAFEHPSALGLQFHLEATREGLAALIQHCGNEIGSGPYEQPIESVASGEASHGAAAKTALYIVLDNISRRVAGFVQ
jgi:GMP synthase (glutamine-hydrolysing)